MILLFRVVLSFVRFGILAAAFNLCGLSDAFRTTFCRLLLTIQRLTTIMKLAVLISLAASAAAFAPAKQTSTSTSALSAFKDEIGAQAPVCVSSNVGLTSYFMKTYTHGSLTLDVLLSLFIYFSWATLTPLASWKARMLLNLLAFVPSKSSTDVLLVSIATTQHNNSMTGSTPAIVTSHLFCSSSCLQCWLLSDT